eukprot:Hpha_TRINITY_DN1711_c0_g1::TRINITY_DN1711_c0_g1_i1::g.158369::m.158369
MGNCFGGVARETEEHFSRLRHLYGIQLSKKEEFKHGRMEHFELTRIFAECEMKINPRAGFDPATGDNMFEELSRFTGMQIDDLIDAAEMYCSLIRDYHFTGPTLVVQMMRWAGIEPHLVRFLCSSLSEDETVSFSVVILPIAIFLKGTPAEKLAFIFSLCDNDGSGELSRSEVEDVLRLTIGDVLTDSRLAGIVEQLFSRIDKNNDGALQFEEFIEHYPYICKLLGMEALEEEPTMVTEEEEGKSASKVRGFLAAVRMMANRRAEKKNDDDRAKTVLAAFRSRLRGTNQAAHVAMSSPKEEEEPDTPPSISLAGPPGRLRNMAPTLSVTDFGNAADGPSPTRTLQVGNRRERFRPQCMNIELPASAGAGECGGSASVAPLSPSAASLQKAADRDRPKLKRLRSTRNFSCDTVGSGGENENNSPSTSPRWLSKRAGTAAGGTRGLGSRAGTGMASGRSSNGSPGSKWGGFGSLFAGRKFFKTQGNKSFISNTSSDGPQMRRRYSDDDFADAAFEVQADQRRQWLESDARKATRGLGGSTVLAAKVVVETTRYCVQTNDGEAMSPVEDDLLAGPDKTPSEDSSDSSRGPRQGLGGRSFTTYSAISAVSGATPSYPRRGTRSTVASGQRLSVNPHMSGHLSRGGSADFNNFAHRQSRGSRGSRGSRDSRESRETPPSPGMPPSLGMPPSPGMGPAGQSPLSPPSGLQSPSPYQSCVSLQPLQPVSPSGPTEHDTPASDTHDVFALRQPAAAEYSRPAGSRTRGMNTPLDPTPPPAQPLGSPNPQMPRNRSVVRFSLHDGSGQVLAAPGSAHMVQQVKSAQGSSTSAPPKPAQGDGEAADTRGAGLLHGLESLQKQQQVLQQEQERLQEEQRRVLQSMQQATQEMLRNMPARDGPADRTSPG